MLSKLQDSGSCFNFENVRDLQLKHFPFSRTHYSCLILLGMLCEQLLLGIAHALPFLVLC